MDVIGARAPEPVGREMIKEAFVARDWKLSNYVEFSLAILVREGFIAGYNIDAGSCGYVVTDFGRLVRERLVTDMVYLENVYFGTYLPFFVKAASQDVYRATCERSVWVAASIYHCWLFLRLVRTAELNGEAYLFDELRTSVVATLDRILRATDVDPRIAGLAYSYIGNFIAMEAA